MGNQVMAIPLGKLVWEWGYGGEKWDFIGILVAISVVVARYKSAGRIALRKEGMTGKVLTRGYDKRYCFDEAGLRVRIRYVKGHGS